MSTWKLLGAVSTLQPLVAVAVSGFFLGPLGSVAAQAAATATIDSAIACVGCRINVGSPIQLTGGLRDGALPSTAQTIRQAADGEIYALFDGEVTYLQVHDSRGSFTGRRIGRSGAGPGEFSAIKDGIQIFGAELHLFDWGLHRRTDLNRHTGAHLRTVQNVPHGYAHMLDLDGQCTVFSGPVQERQTVGQPLHVYCRGASGYEWRRSFGTDDPAFRPGMSSLLFRRLAPADSGAFWSAPINEYKLEQWNASGRLLRSVSLPRAWFTTWTQRIVRSTERPPNPNVTGLSVDSLGRMWVLLHVPHERWADALSDERDIMGSRLLRPNRPYLIAIIEVIDLTTHRLLARHRFAHALWGFAGPTTVWRTWTDDRTGEPRAELIPLELTERAR